MNTLVYFFLGVFLTATQEAPFLMAVVSFPPASLTTTPAMPLDTITVEEMENVTLHCHTPRSEKRIVFWIHYAQPSKTPTRLFAGPRNVGHNPRFSLVNGTSSLHISPVWASDAGFFTCGTPRSQMSASYRLVVENSSSTAETWDDGSSSALFTDSDFVVLSSADPEPSPTSTRTEPTSTDSPTIAPASTSTTTVAAPSAALRYHEKPEIGPVTSMPEEILVAEYEDEEDGDDHPEAPMILQLTGERHRSDDDDTSDTQPVMPVFYNDDVEREETFLEHQRRSSSYPESRASAAKFRPDGDGDGDVEVEVVKGFIRPSSVVSFLKQSQEIHIDLTNDTLVQIHLPAVETIATSPTTTITDSPPIVAKVNVVEKFVQFFNHGNATAFVNMTSLKIRANRNETYWTNETIFGNDTSFNVSLVEVTLGHTNVTVLPKTKHSENDTQFDVAIAIIPLLSTVAPTTPSTAVPPTSPSQPPSSTAKFTWNPKGVTSLVGFVRAARSGATFPFLSCIYLWVFFLVATFV